MMKQVWWLRTLLPDLPGESEVASLRVPGPSGGWNDAYDLAVPLWMSGNSRGRCWLPKEVPQDGIRVRAIGGVGL